MFRKDEIIFTLYTICRQRSDLSLNSFLYLSMYSQKVLEQYEMNVLSMAGVCLLLFSAKDSLHGSGSLILCCVGVANIEGQATTQGYAAKNIHHKKIGYCMTAKPVNIRS